MEINKLAATILKQYVIIWNCNKQRPLSDEDK